MDYEHVPLSSLNYGPEEETDLKKLIEEEVNQRILACDQQFIKGSPLCRSFLECYGNKARETDEELKQLSFFLSITGFQEGEVKAEYSRYVREVLDSIIINWSKPSTESPLHRTLIKIAAEMSERYREILGEPDTSDKVVRYKSNFPNRNIPEINFDSIIEKTFVEYFGKQFQKLASKKQRTPPEPEEEFSAQPETQQTHYHLPKNPSPNEAQLREPPVMKAQRSQGNSTKVQQLQPPPAQQAQPINIIARAKEIEKIFAMCEHLKSILSLRVDRPTDHR